MGVSHVAVGGKSILSDEGSKCKGPEAEANLVCSGNVGRPVGSNLDSTFETTKVNKVHFCYLFQTFYVLKI